MLNNIFFLPIVSLSIKNNFFFINTVCYKIPSWFLININIFNIYFFEKTLIDLNIKQFYYFFFKTNLFLFFFIQVTLLILFL